MTEQEAQTARYEYSEDGTKLHPIEYKNDKWVYFGDYDAYKLKFRPSQSKRGNAFKLSEESKTYCWIKVDGYNNFSSWTK